MPQLLPTIEQIAVLQQASNFGYQYWQTKTNVAQSFLKSYPLTQTLDVQHIKDLIRDYTLDEDYQLADEASVMRGLRHLRNLLMMRWIWQDALNLISLEQLTWELSKFADYCLIFAKDYVYQDLISRYGEPYFFDEKNKPHKDDLAIIAMEARSYVARELVQLGGEPVYREGFVTDYGNLILDVYGLDIGLDSEKVAAFEAKLNNIVGVVCNGLFSAQRADILLMATADGVKKLTAK